MNLQLALIAIGIVVVAAIYFYSRWEAPRNRHKRQRSAVSSPTEPSFGREEPSLVTDLDADYQGYVDDDSAFSTDSYLDADSAIEANQDEDIDEGIVEAKYSKSVELKLSEETAQEEEATDYQERLEGDILTTDIPVLDSRVDMEGELSEEQAPHDGGGTPSWEDSETESASDASDYEKSSHEVRVQSDDHSDTASLDEQVVESANLLEEGEQDASYRSEPEPEAEAQPEPEPEPESVPVHEFESHEATAAEEQSEVQGFDQSTDLSEENSEYHESADVEAIEGYSQTDMEQIEEFREDADEAPEALQEKPSLKRFLGSIKQIHKIKDSIQHKLDAVKAEREKVWDEDDETAPESPEAKPAMVQEQRGLFDEDDALTTPAQSINEEETTTRDDARREPSLGGEGAFTEAESEHGSESDSTPESKGNNGVSITAAEGFEKLSQIDYYVKLSGERDVSRDSVLAIYREGASELSKTHSIYGLRMPDKVWRDLENEPEESRFGDLVITIQLADQNGPVTEQDMTRFSGLVMKLSESTGRGFAFMAPIESAHEQAQAIEKFRKRFDSIFVVNIRPLEEETFDGAMIERCATQIGLTPDENNFYARYKPVGKQKVCLYSLANMSDTGEFDMENLRGLKTRGVTFFTRPAVNRSPGAVFSEMVDAAKAFASRIKGEAIAPGYDDLSMEDVEAIRKSIEKVAREMESYGIIPGSEEATRLF